MYSDGWHWAFFESPNQLNHCIANWFTVFEALQSNHLSRVIWFRAERQSSFVNLLIQIGISVRSGKHFANIMIHLPKFWFRSKDSRTYIKNGIYIRWFTISARDPIWIKRFTIHISDQDFKSFDSGREFRLIKKKKFEKQNNEKKNRQIQIP